MNKTPDLINAVSALELCTIDDLAEYLKRNKKSLERTLPKLVSTKQIYRVRWGSTEPFIYSVRDITRRSAFTVTHELMITGIHTTLYRTGLLMDWRQGKEDWRGEVHQDAFCTLQVGEKSLDVFIEADNGTMNSKDMEKKIRAYLNLFEEVKSPFKVLFVTNSQSRARNLSKLSEATVSEKKRKLYLFTTIDQFRVNPLGEICFIPYEIDPQRLLPRMV